MRLSIFLCILALQCVGQDCSEGHSYYQQARAEVHDALNAERPDFFGSAIREMVLSGDHVAVDILRELPLEQLRNPLNGRRVLAILDNAFLDPRLIRDPLDKDPAVSLLLLKYIELNNTDESVRALVTQHREWILKKLTNQNK